MLNQRHYHYLLFVLSLGLYIAIGYKIQRYETTPLFICYFFLFCIYCWILAEKKELQFWIWFAILFRIALLFSVPALSDDFYRFIWDGRLLAAGYNPFDYVPEHYMHPGNLLPGLDASLYNNLNSRDYFTVYPPLSQYLFWISVRISPDSVYRSMVIMKIILVTCEVGSIMILTKILKVLNHQPAKVLIYALNPLVVIEISGNLHLEGLMLFALLLSVWFLLCNRRFLSATFFALSICTKLIPLILAPLLLRHLGWKKALPYGLVTGTVTLLLFLPLLDQHIIYGLMNGLGYYFQKFEFNASLYYLIRGAGYYLFGFNIIQIAGWLLALVSGLSIVGISFYHKRNSMSNPIDVKFFALMMWCLFIFYLMTTTVHPWYIISLIMISVFTGYRFPILWSGLIFLTYFGYSDKTFSENLQIVAVEYILVAGCLFYETVWTKRVNHS